jgi:hypothetical protein
MSQVPSRVAEKRPSVKRSVVEKTATLIWIDSREAYVVRWHDGIGKIEHLESDVPVHRRTTGGSRPTPGRSTGGVGVPQASVEGRRLEHLARFVTRVAQRVPRENDVLIIGPGTVREHLARELTETDVRTHDSRLLACRAAAPMTVPQLVATLRAEIGETAPRKSVRRRTRAPKNVVRPPSSALMDELDELGDVAATPATHEE